MGLLVMWLVVVWLFLIDAPQPLVSRSLAVYLFDSVGKNGCPLPQETGLSGRKLPISPTGDSVVYTRQSDTMFDTTGQFSGSMLVCGEFY